MQFCEAKILFRNLTPTDLLMCYHINKKRTNVTFVLMFEVKNKQ
jgi:hypothetical protein